MTRQENHYFIARVKRVMFTLEGYAVLDTAPGIQKL